MAAIELQSPKAICSAEILAAVLGLSTRHVRRLTGDGVLTLIRRNGKHPRYRLADSVQRYLKHQKHYITADLSRPDDAYQAARTERMCALAKIEQIRVDEMRGRLHRAEDIEFCLTHILTYFKQGVLAIPSRVARLCVGKAFREIHDLLTSEMHLVLRTLSGYDPAMFAQQRAEYLASKGVDLSSVNGEGEAEGVGQPC